MSNNEIIELVEGREYRDAEARAVIGQLAAGDLVEVWMKSGYGYAGKIQRGGGRVKLRLDNGSDVWLTWSVRINGLTCHVTRLTVTHIAPREPEWAKARAVIPLYFNGCPGSPRVRCEDGLWRITLGGGPLSTDKLATKFSDFIPLPDEVVDAIWPELAKPTEPERRVLIDRLGNAWFEVEDGAFTAHPVAWFDGLEDTMARGVIERMCGIREELVLR